MTGAGQRPMLSDARLIRQARQRVVFAEDGDHRAILAGLAHDGGGDAGDVLGDAAALLLQHRGVLGAGAVLGVGDLRHGPDAVGQCLEIVFFGVDQAPDFLGVLHRRYSFGGPAVSA